MYTHLISFSKVTTSTQHFMKNYKLFDLIVIARIKLQ